MHWGENVYIGLYRMLGGRWVDRWTAGAPAILLITTGRRTGLPRTVALGHMRIGEDLVVAATNGGLAPVPGWVWNLRADPRCRVEVGRERFTATAECLEGEEYLDYWNRLVSEYPIYQTARDMLERPIPLVVLQPAAE
jgi:deazaflavin-dependent oxidoreductase (nitroreductase family)